MKNIDGQILNIAVPAIITNITVPLLGLVDITIVGHMGDAAYIGAIAVGTMVFNMIYWIFGFLRAGTAGITAQEYGARTDTTGTLIRAFTIAIVIGLIITAAQALVKYAGMAIMQPQGLTRNLVATYISICIYGAPAVLGLYSLTGWFIGMQNTRLPMVISITQNIINIACSITFVYALGMKVEGVALGTLIAQWTGFAMAILLVRKFSKGNDRSASMNNTLNKQQLIKLRDKHALIRFFSVNRDLFIRTLFIVGVNVLFTAAGSRQGTTILAVNTLLFTFFTLYSYIMDGFAYAGEALCGKFYGAEDKLNLKMTARRLFIWGTALTIIYTLIYSLGGTAFLTLLTNEAEVITTAKHYLPWAVAIPIAGMGAFLWDGIYIGLTETRGMLISSCLSACAFTIIWITLSTTMENHALWLALITYLAMRGIIQTIIKPRGISL